MSDKTIVIDTPEGIEHYRMCVLIASLKLEIKSGMKMSRFSLVKSAQSLYGVKARTKTKVLEELLALYKNTYGMEYADGK